MLLILLTCWVGAEVLEWMQVASAGDAGELIGLAPYAREEALGFAAAGRIEESELDIVGEMQAGHILPLRS